METNDGKNKWATIVIGAGQAGLATGYYLSKIDEDFVIIDRESQLGDSWRKRWDSLRLFTPAQHDGLPGLRFPAKRGSLPTKDEMADYLVQYAKQFNLPVRTGVEITELSKKENNFEITTSAGTLYAEQVVVATGTHPVAHIPAFADELNKEIFQVHSSRYKNPQSLPPGISLVVGAGTSGVQIALELSKSRTTMLSGHPTPHIPDPIFKYAGELYWWLVSNVLTINTPIGRKVKSKILSSGAPLISVSYEDVKAAGIEHLPRLSGAKDGLPVLENGRTLSVASIIWSTGFKPDFGWIRMNVTDETGWPRTHRGISKDVEGLFFTGMPFQFGLTSGLVGGVGRDAAFVVNHLHNHKHPGP